MPTPPPAAATQGADSKPDPIVGGPFSVPEAHELFQREQASREELTYEQKLALDHAATFSRIPAQKARELREQVRAISPRVTDAHAAKIADIAPTHPDDVRAIFARDRIPLDNEDIDKIIQAVRNYL